MLLFVRGVITRDKQQKSNLYRGDYFGGHPVPRCARPVFTKYESRAILSCTHQTNYMNNSLLKLWYGSYVFCGFFAMLCIERNIVAILIATKRYIQKRHHDSLNNISYNVVKSILLNKYIEDKWYTVILYFSNQLASFCCLAINIIWIIILTFELIRPICLFQ